MDEIWELYNLREEAPTCKLVKKGKYKGFEYFITWYYNHPNAYIKIPKEHPFFERDFKDVDDKWLVHGGFTFSGKNLHKDNKLEDGWYLGWDYAHAGDYQLFSDGFELKEKKWTTSEIENECKTIIKEIIVKGK